MRFDEWWEQYKEYNMPNATKEEASQIWDAALENMKSEILSDFEKFGYIRPECHDHCSSD